ncbi:hypothetical protein DSM110093_03681 (plasmid) [Sulfitobacter sp. DSM 110093]|uniref:hypothetical protein n=1 Tax=Sulfitobacter sp. DSM 110093 TaxID=2883127 RepID=UPI001FACF969|nr:hypothetical protein [Sulfitobacter sp. DSM 110093]UOA33846.1 hypothetical protein DSM110093_03681 [Sulfitobacter sp. DSM 110093]
MNHTGYLRDLAIAVVGIGFALLALVFWIPQDIDTTVIDVWRRNVRIGDAMLPAFSAIGMAVAATVIGLRALLSRTGEDVGEIKPRFLIWLTLVLAVGLGLMMVAGPLIAWAFTGGETSYRLLLATAPWKYLGFLLGGTVMTFALMALCAPQATWRLGLLAFVATLVIALLYDLPFDNLLLPPNGDF